MGSSSCCHNSLAFYERPFTLADDRWRKSFGRPPPYDGAGCADAPASRPLVPQCADAARPTGRTTSTLTCGVNCQRGSSSTTPERARRRANDTNVDSGAGPLESDSQTDPAPLATLWSPSSTEEMLLATTPPQSERTIGPTSDGKRFIDGLPCGYRRTFNISQEQPINFKVEPDSDLRRLEDHDRQLGKPGAALINSRKQPETNDIARPNSRAFLRVNGHGLRTAGCDDEPRKRDHWTEKRKQRPSGCDDQLNGHEQRLDGYQIDSGGATNTLFDPIRVEERERRAAAAFGDLQVRSRSVCLDLKLDLPAHVRLRASGDDPDMVVATPATTGAQQTVSGCFPRASASRKNFADSSLPPALMALDPDDLDEQTSCVRPPPNQSPFEDRTSLHCNSRPGGSARQFRPEPPRHRSRGEARPLYRRLNTASESSLLPPSCSSWCASPFSSSSSTASSTLSLTSCTSSSAASTASLSPLSRVGAVSTPGKKLSRPETMREPCGVPDASARGDDLESRAHSASEERIWPDKTVLVEGAATACTLIRSKSSSNNGSNSACESCTNASSLSRQKPL